MKVFVAIDTRDGAIYGCFTDKERAQRYIVACGSNFVVKKLKVYKGK
jgi:phosphoribosylamine-glycine ligase